MPPRAHPELVLHGLLGGRTMRASPALRCPMGGARRRGRIPHHSSPSRSLTRRGGHRGQSPLRRQPVDAQTGLPKVGAPHGHSLSRQCPPASAEPSESVHKPLARRPPVSSWVVTNNRSLPTKQGARQVQARERAREGRSQRVRDRRLRERADIRSVDPTIPQGCSQCRQRGDSIATAATGSDRQPRAPSSSRSSTAP